MVSLHPIHHLSVYLISIYDIVRMAAGRRLGQPLIDGSYWMINFYSTSPSTCPSEGFLKIDLYVNRTSLINDEDRQSQEFRRLFHIPVPTLHFPGTMNRDQYKSALQRWLQTMNLVDFPLFEEDVVNDFTNLVLEHVFFNVNLHEMLAIHVVIELEHVQTAPLELELESESELDQDSEGRNEVEEGVWKGLSESWIKLLRHLYASVFWEEEGLEEDCSICLNDLVSKDGEEQKKNRLFRSPCQHVFHDNCMTKWLRNNDSCPLCRFVVSSTIRSLLKKL